MMVGATPSTTGPGSVTPPAPDGFLDEDQTDLRSGLPVSPPPLAANVAEEPPIPVRQKLHELSRVYKHPLLKVEFTVEAFVVGACDSDLPTKSPWTLKIEDPGTRTFLFLFNPDHPVFRSVTMTPLDALLCELAFKTYEFLRETSPTPVMFAAILADLRNEYANETKLDSKNIIAFADQALNEIAKSIGLANDLGACVELFNSLPSEGQDKIRRKLASTGASNAQQVIESGEFLGYADAADVRLFVQQHPDLFFDGKFWAQPYMTLNYGNQKVDEEARARVRERFDAYLADAVWLASQSPRDLDRCDRDELIRATLSVRILRSDGSH